ncbi:dnaJ-like DjlA domain protein, partial [Vibrio parahaemolyticus V-223/04]
MQHITFAWMDSSISKGRGNLQFKEELQQIKTASG